MRGVIQIDGENSDANVDENQQFELSNNHKTPLPREATLYQKRSLQAVESGNIQRAWRPNMSLSHRSAQSIWHWMLKPRVSTNSQTDRRTDGRTDG